jgi:hypothetical protein
MKFDACAMGALALIALANHFIKRAVCSFGAAVPHAIHVSLPACKSRGYPKLCREPSATWITGPAALVAET